MEPAPNRRVTVVPGAGARALLLDAMGTLVRLEPPVPALVAALADAGFANDEAVVAAALRTEIAFYRANHLRGADRPGLAHLRSDCAAVFAGALTVAPPLPELAEILVSALRFAPFDDVVPLLTACRDLEIRTAVVSDWDCTLARHLADMGIAQLLDAVVVSAEVGAAKPDRRIFAAALEAVGVGPAAALHVGDDPRRDLEGAASAGVAGVLLDRDGRHEDITPRVATLTEVRELL
jgi:FMN phosphatase YigB (HAD superfamily)